MAKTNNLITSTTTITICNSTDITINQNLKLVNNNASNVYIHIKVCKACRTIKYITVLSKGKEGRHGYQSQCKNFINNRQNNIMMQLKIKLTNMKKNIMIFIRIKLVLNVIKLNV